jgi:hypothetical protein
MRRKHSLPVQGGFPLAAVILLVTTVAALLACIDMPKVRAELETIDEGYEFLFGVAIIFVVGSAVGSVIGLMGPRRAGGFFLGAAIGGLAALALVPLSLAPANIWRCLGAVSLLLVTSIVVRAGAR